MAIAMRISSSLALARLSFLALWDWPLESTGPRKHRLSQDCKCERIATMDCEVLECNELSQGYHSNLPVRM